MLGKGKSSGMINEATNLKANQNLTAAIDSMGTRAYQQSRDESDVIPTHRRPVQEAKRDNGVPVYDPELEKKATRAERGGYDDAEASDDDELLNLRRQRMTMLKAQHNKETEWRSKQHGEYREISQDEFFDIVVREKGGSENCCIHFYHKDFETCKVMDRRLSELAKTMLAVKFAKIDAERSPFLVERLQIMTLPCCLLFHNDICVDRIYGFDGCATEDGLLDPDLLRERVELTLHLGEFAEAE